MSNYTSWANDTVQPVIKIENPPTNIVESLVKINVGAGPSCFPFDNWVNIDREDFAYYVKWISENTTAYAKYLKDLIVYVKNGGKLQYIIHDINNGLPQYKANAVDLIYFGQAIEHTNYVFQIPKILKEFYRVLKPNGLVRITTPDLDLLINDYINGKMDKYNDDQPELYKSIDPSAKLAMLMYGASGETCTQSHYDGHFFLYTKTSLTKILKDAGFEKIIFYDSPGQSYHPVMAKEAVDQGISHSLICEAVK